VQESCVCKQCIPAACMGFSKCILLWVVICFLVLAGVRSRDICIVLSFAAAITSCGVAANYKFIINFDWFKLNHTMQSCGSGAFVKHCSCALIITTCEIAKRKSIIFFIKI
jgi:hypothetical protein